MIDILKIWLGITIIGSFACMGLVFYYMHKEIAPLVFIWTVGAASFSVVTVKNMEMLRKEAKK